MMQKSFFIMGIMLLAVPGYAMEGTSQGTHLRLFTNDEKSVMVSLTQAQQILPLRLMLESDKLISQEDDTIPIPVSHVGLMRFIELMMTAEKMNASKSLAQADFSRDVLLYRQMRSGTPEQTIELMKVLHWAQLFDKWLAKMYEYQAEMLFRTGLDANSFELYQKLIESLPNNTDVGHADHLYDLWLTRGNIQDQKADRIVGTINGILAYMPNDEGFFISRTTSNENDQNGAYLSRYVFDEQGNIDSRKAQHEKLLFSAIDNGVVSPSERYILLRQGSRIGLYNTKECTFDLKIDIHAPKIKEKSMMAVDDVGTIYFEENGHTIILCNFDKNNSLFPALCRPSAESLLVGLAATSCGDRVVAGYNEYGTTGPGKVALYDTAQQKKVSSFTVAPYVRKMLLPGDGMTLLTMGSDNFVKIWDMRSEACVRSMWHAGPSCVALDSAQTMIAIVADMGIHLWDSYAGKERAIAHYYGKGIIKNIAFNHASTEFAVACVRDEESLEYIHPLPCGFALSTTPLAYTTLYTWIKRYAISDNVEQRKKMRQEDLYPQTLEEFVVLSNQLEDTCTQDCPEHLQEAHAKIFEKHRRYRYEQLNPFRSVSQESSTQKTQQPDDKEQFERKIDSCKQS